MKTKFAKINNNRRTKVYPKRNIEKQNHMAVQRSVERYYEYGIKKG